MTSSHKWFRHFIISECITAIVFLCAWGRVAGENVCNWTTYEYQILCFYAEITSGDVNHVAACVWYEAMKKSKAYDWQTLPWWTSVLTINRVVVLINVNKWSKCACARGCQKWQGNLYTILYQRFGISVGRCHSILHDVLNMRRVCQHLVPRLLTP